MSHPRSNPQPGDFGLTVITGWTGFWVKVAQLLTGDGSHWTHAFIVGENDTAIEIAPGGMRMIELSDYANRDVAYSSWPLDDWEREKVIQRACAHLRADAQYSYAVYLALALYAIGIKPQWLRDYVENSGRMECAQFVDECYRYAGVQLFDDGREPMDVTPGDLTYVLSERKTQ